MQYPSLDLPDQVWIVVTAPAICPTCRQEDYDHTEIYAASTTVIGVFYSRSGEIAVRVMYGDYTEVERPVGQVYWTKEQAEAAVSEAERKMQDQD